MSQIQLTIGQKIKEYRKVYNMTLKELADKINKSKSTLSKYESGEVSIDIETLLQISDALGIHIFQLLEPISKITHISPSVKKNNFFPETSQIHIYYYDGRNNRIRHGIIKMFHDTGTNSRQIILHNNIGERERRQGIEYFCNGEMTSYDTFTIFSFEQRNGIGNAYIYAYNPFGSTSMVNGILVGIFKNPIAPGAMKVILSSEEISEQEKLSQQLTFTKEDYKNFKKINMMIIDNQT